jgi:ArsR family transcriptional regulator
MMELKRAQYLTKLLRAFGHPARVRIIEMLSARESNVKTITAGVKLPQPVVSQQLAVLREVGIVEFERKGNQVIYRVTKPWVKLLIKDLARVPKEG